MLPLTPTSDDDITHHPPPFFSHNKQNHHQHMTGLLILYSTQTDVFMAAQQAATSDVE
ncbi:hypothetical protein DPMN_010854 [Dreissena polymorpha]|uniref:Uncharacterized protein n=1 Tax=Dreissena polymorpha TaxID=45954 RepID=A0A9D4N302_DREPO|nr:hypothetical protein DPMN_010854 [Dreissena polymorpha]